MPWLASSSAGDVDRVEEDRGAVRVGLHCFDRSLFAEEFADVRSDDLAGDLPAFGGHGLIDLHAESAGFQHSAGCGRGRLGVLERGAHLAGDEWMLGRVLTSDLRVPPGEIDRALISRVQAICLKAVSAAPDIFEIISNASRESGLGVLVIGGHAINAYGYARTTLDADLMVCVDDLPAWRTILEKTGYRWAGETSTFAKLEPATDSDLLLPIDIMLVTRETLEKIQAQQTILAFGQSRLPVPSPLHLIALKLHALKNPDRLRAGRDLTDILQLIRICRIDPESDGFREIVESYASNETRRLLARHLADE